MFRERRGRPYGRGTTVPRVSPVYAKQDVGMGTNIIMLNELATASDRDTDSAKHAFTLAQPGILALFVLDIDVESLALQEYLQVSVVLQYGMRGDFVEHALKRLPTGFHKVRIKTSNSLLLGRRRYNDTGVVVVELVI